ncbi:amino acid transporter [Actinoplanes tereljensis]|uniref:Uncharacterized protein n=1 Tax=Paractinoplanes tereljensis TaxID=571912 RepID=A0A919TT96_9ACTN|nr:hypothetical protein [Actinoplanes tereljensis]GIF22293.1 hypothetical protein Ate02nite_50230 [Actinoplanes tereljensis]
MRRPVVGILVATVAAMVVVLVAGGPDRGTVALMLLVVVPFLIAFGGGSDAGWRASPPEPDTPWWARLMFLPAVLGQVAVVVVVTWQVVTSAVGGAVVSGIALIPLALVAAWRSWQLSLRLSPRTNRARTPPPPGAQTEPRGDVGVRSDGSPLA